MIYPDSHRQLNTVILKIPLFAHESDLFTNFIKENFTLSHVFLKNCLDIFGHPLF